MKDRYRQQVALLIRIMPSVYSVYKIKAFAVHGGTAINLFCKNMPRYSVDIDLTYIPIGDRATSLAEINLNLLEVKRYIEKHSWNNCKAQARCVEVVMHVGRSNG